MHTSARYHAVFNIAVLAAGLGFFIDAFDLFLFNVYRIPSLKDLHIEAADIQSKGEFLLAVQMAGMMVGGILSGMLADRNGRATVLMGSIVLYSLANLANGFVQDVNTYAIIRFLAGVGLAGELGAGIALVGENMSAEKRGYGTILVATMGGLGAVSAGLAATFIPWRYAFIGAGFAGFLLLFLRMRSMETGLFQKVKAQQMPRGSFRLLFASKKRCLLYLSCILVGIPIWYSVGLLITLSPELARLHQLSGLELGFCFMLFQAGITLGDLSSGLFSQFIRSRKKAILLFMGMAITGTILHFFQLYQQHAIEWTSFLMGLGCGYLSVFVTLTAEQFGTNLRVTATATVTNFMRGAVVILVPFHQWLESRWQITLTESLMITGGLVWLLALLGLTYLHETYGRDLDFIES
jgi:putative MFS transporter